MSLKLRVMTKFPAVFLAGTGIAVERVGRAYTAVLDWLSVETVDSVADPTTRYVLMVSGTDTSDQVYERIALDKFATTISAQVQEITTAGNYNVEASAAIVKVDLSVAGAVNLALPAASNKIGEVLIADYGGTASVANPITVTPNGLEEFSGGATSWVISSAGASARFFPIPSSGYAV